jgi:hypothetical protein
MIKFFSFGFNNLANVSNFKGKKKNENSCFFKGFWITEIDGSLILQRRRNQRSLI